MFATKRGSFSETKIIKGDLKNERIRLYKKHHLFQHR